MTRIPKEIPTGEKFGDLIVIGPKKKIDKRTHWKCKCICGVEKYHGAWDLFNGKIKTCGSCAQIKDLTGKSFGKLIVTKFSHINRRRSACWVCKCKCGGKKVVPSNYLIGNITRSCGCLNKIIDITGEKIGFLCVIGFAHSNNGRAYWSCKCECGNIKSIEGRALRNGDTKSCGCILSSRENILFGILKDIFPDTKVCRYYEFEWLIYNKKQHLDFYIPSIKTAIEYNGQQHYKPVDFAGKGIKWATERFKYGQKLDDNKKILLKNHNINLIEVPYFYELTRKNIEKLFDTIVRQN